MRPTVGRIVHYINLGDKDGKYPPQVQAAVITGIYRIKDVAQRAEGENLELINDGVGTPDDAVSSLVDLKVFYKTGLFDCTRIPQRKSSEQRGCWDWPPRV